MSKKSNQKYHDHLRDERSHMEGLLNQRYNFFILIFGFIIASIPFIKSEDQLRLIFIVGFIIELMFTLLIGRAYRRLRINMKMLKDFDDPANHISKKAEKGFCLNPLRYSMVVLIGYFIPYSNNNSFVNCNYLDTGYL